MDKLTSFLNDVYGAHLSQTFEKRASYNADMDFLEYVSRDEITVSDRIDPFLTVMWDYDQKEIVGFRLKGFHCLFAKYVQPILQLREEDFELLAVALQSAFTEIGNTIFSDQAHKGQKDERAKAYKSALKLVKSERVDLPPQFKQAA